MRKERKKYCFPSVLEFLSSVLLFSCIVGLVVVVLLFLFVSNGSLNLSNVMELLPAIIGMVLLVGILFAGSDFYRRYQTVERPVREIKIALDQLIGGDFATRITISKEMTNEYHFDEIATSINALAQELSGVETLRTDFIANVSHELKTPLAAIQHYSMMLQESGLSEAERLEYAGIITESSGRLTSLITNILKLNKLENQQIFPAVKKYNLSEQLCESLLQFEPVWEKKNIQIETDIAEGIVVLSDAELSSLCWNNLLSNAFKFTEQGGQVSVTLTADDTYATIKIADTGCGMTPEVGAHIFEKFYQGDTSHAVQGNGLGLALVKRVVDIMHGEIGVESVPGTGSIFTVTIRRNWHERLEDNM